MYACMHVLICMEKSEINRVQNQICTQLGMLRCKFYVIVFPGEPNTQNLKPPKHTTHKCMYIYIYCIYTYLSEQVQTINTCACMHVCMYVCMDGWIYGCVEKSQINRVLNEICTQLGMLRCKFYVVVFLGETNTQNLCFLNMNFKKQENNTQHTHTCCIYIHICGNHRYVNCLSAVFFLGFNKASYIFCMFKNMLQVFISVSLIRQF